MVVLRKGRKFYGIRLNRSLNSKLRMDAPLFNGLKYPTNKGYSNRHGHQQPLKYQNKRLFKRIHEGASMRPRHGRQTTLPMLRQEKEKQD